MYGTTNIKWMFMRVDGFFENRSRKFKLYSNLPEITVLYMETNTHVSSYLARLFLEIKMFQTNFVEKNKTRLLCIAIIFSIIVPL